MRRSTIKMQNREMAASDSSLPRQAVPRSAAFANPFDVSHAYRVTMGLALAMAVLPGLGTGLFLVMIAGLGLPMFAAWPELAQAHGQIQALGFVDLFIIAVALQLFPRFLATPLEHSERVVWSAWLLAAALVLRLLGQPLQPGALRSVVLVGSSVGLPLGLFVAGSAFHTLRRGSIQPSSGPSAAWRRFVGVGGVALGAVIGLWIWSNLSLATGDAVVGAARDEALIHLELAGFATSIVFAVASRIFGRFLLLRARPGLDSYLPALAVGWGVGLALTAGGWLLGDFGGVWVRWAGSSVELIVVLIWMWLIGLYGRPTRASGTPYVTGPTRRWVRLAFGFLLLGLVLDWVLYGREAMNGTVPTFVQLSAARHAIAQGFLLPLMVSMAARLLPVLSADVLKHRVRLEWTIDLLLVGALLRVMAEFTEGYAGLSGNTVALGGVISVIAFYLFAAQLWSSLGRLPRPAALLTGATHGASPDRAGGSSR